MRLLSEQPLSTIAHGIAGFKIDLSIVLGNFAFQKLGIVNDLRQYANQFANHNIIAAIAGDSKARQLIQRLQTPINNRDLDQVSPDHDFLILDADSSQQRAIAAILAGQSGVIQGPPGTGKSQTIANLIAVLTANGKRVLFVAEKQAALDVVYHRLLQAKLGHIILNLHDSKISQRAILEQINRSLMTARRPPLVNNGLLHKYFSELRDQLNDHVFRLHQPRLPSDLSIYRLYEKLLSIPSEINSQTRWQNKELLHITADNVVQARSLLIEASSLSDLFLYRHPSLWSHAHLIDRMSVDKALKLVERLAKKYLPRLVEATRDASIAASLPPPATVAEILILLELLPYIAATLTDYEPTIFDENLNNLVKQLAPAEKGRIQALWSLVSNGDYRRAYQIALGHIKHRGIVWPWRIYNEIAQAVPYQEKWLATLGDDALVPEATQLQLVYRALERAQAEIVGDDLLKLAGLFPNSLLLKLFRTNRLDTVSFKNLRGFVNRLLSDIEIAYQIPYVRNIQSKFDQLGITLFLRELRKSQSPIEQWTLRFEHAWVTSCIEQAWRDEPKIATFNGIKHKHLVEEFRQADLDRIQMAAGRVARKHAEQVLEARNPHIDQDNIIQQEIRKKRSHLSMRKLVSRAGDILTAICPCWMASPLTVSQFIPADKRYFDVVIFDEASQVVPEDAIAALLRGSTVVVAGDKHQLPPTRFFAGSEAEIDNDEQDSPEQGFESLLDLMGTFLEPWPLLWHYRSRDESLIAFANRYIYDNKLISFPSPHSTQAVRHVLVPFDINALEPQEESNTAEVQRVVELIFEHVEQQSQASLGVITLGVNHMQRLQAALDKARQDRPELDSFFVEDKKDHFFIKNLERVQGDERDVIILSLGCTKNRKGQLHYTVFGPLLRDGGERRLNVAITRARRQMMVISSFDVTDMPVGRSKARGVELLREFLIYASQNKLYFGTDIADNQPIDRFEEDIYRELTARNLIVEPQLGASEARITFAVRHPTRRDEYVLAIETDGPAYLSAPTASERDRLRQQQLENLGWYYHRIWCLDWYYRREETITGILASYEEAVLAADRCQLVVEPASAGGPVLSGESPLELDEHEAAKLMASRGTRPDVKQGLDSSSYTSTQLVPLVRWINSDGILRTAEEIIQVMQKDLGIKRLGSRMRKTLQGAIEMERRHQKRS
jgi:MinD-like ATPase involved in chromosome partitioning or flagellar assembly